MGPPAMALTAPRDTPAEQIETLREPPGWVTNYSTTNFSDRVDLSSMACIHTHYLSEALPAVAPDLAPNCLAPYLGCTGVEMPGTVWCRPCIGRPEEASFAFDPDNFYWRFSLELGRQ